ncbi:hydrolase, partial [Paenibacillus riograndensis]
MTKKLYYESAYLKDWHTSVSQVVEREDGQYLILEETAFYPHGGGQHCDAGTSGGIPVVAVISAENVVLHKVESPEFIAHS